MSIKFWSLNSICLVIKRGDKSLRRMRLDACRKLPWEGEKAQETYPLYRQHTQTFNIFEAWTSAFRNPVYLFQQLKNSSFWWVSLAVCVCVSTCKKSKYEWKWSWWKSKGEKSLEDDKLLYWHSSHMCNS